MEEENKYIINIPGNIKLRLEVINGVGIKELITTGIAGAISIVIAFIIFQITQNYLITVGTFVVITGGTFVLVMKDKNNTSIADLLKWITRFYKNQKYFKYKINEEDK